MLAAERQRRILELLRVGGSLRTIDAAEALEVSDETIRKDFEILEKRGALVRSHGGAIRPAGMLGELGFLERRAMQREEKLAIARLAIEHIEPNQIIFLDASSTALTLAECLPNVPLTILTNALSVLTALAERPQFELMSTGGLFDAKSRSFIGLTAEKSLQRYHIHRAFLSGRGLDIVRGASESNSQQAAFKERVVASAEQVVFLADHTKLGSKASFFFADVTALHCVISDGSANRNWLRELDELGIEIKIATPEPRPA